MHPGHVHVQTVQRPVDLLAVLAAVRHPVGEVDVLHVFAHVAAILAHLAA